RTPPGDRSSRAGDPSAGSSARGTGATARLISAAALRPTPRPADGSPAPEPAPFLSLRLPQPHPAAYSHDVPPPPCLSAFTYFVSPSLRHFLITTRLRPRVRHGPLRQAVGAPPQLAVQH